MPSKNKNKPPRGALREPAFAEDTLTSVSRKFMRGLTPSRVVAIIENARRKIADQMVLAHELEESDDHLRGTLSLRRKAVGRLDVQVVSGDAEDDRANEAADALREIVARPWFTQASDAMLRSIFEQHAAVEIFYDRDWMPTGFRPVEPGRWDFAPDDLRPRLRKELLSDTNWVELTPGRFAWMSYEATAIPGDNALVRAAVMLLLFAKLGLKQFGTVIDQWGLPLLRVQYQAGLGQNEIQTIVDEILALAGRRIVATPAGTTVETTDPPEHAPHIDAQDFARRCISRLLLGQDSSQMVTEGQQTGATLQGHVRDDIRDDDAGLLDAAQNETFVGPWCAWVFGPEVAPPRIVRSVKQVRDPVQRAGVFQAARELGLRVKSEQVYRELDIEMPDDTPEILEPAMSVPLSGAEFGVEPQSTQRTQSGEIAAGAGAAGVPAAGSVANTGLNGAQVTSLTELLQTVTTKQQSPEVAKALISAAFPMISAELVATMVTAAANFEPAVSGLDAAASAQDRSASAPTGAAAAEQTARPAGEETVASTWRCSVNQGPLCASCASVLKQSSLPETAVESAAREYGELIAPLREQIKTIASEIDAMELGDAEKVTMLRARLPELLGGEYGTKRRAELIHQATMASFARGAVRTHEQAARRGAKAGG